MACDLIEPPRTRVNCNQPCNRILLVVNSARYGPLQSSERGSLAAIPRLGRSKPRCETRVFLLEEARQMTDWAVTVNLGGEWQEVTRKMGMLAWTRDVLLARRPAIVFAQETFAGWAETLGAEGYRIAMGMDRGWKVRSALVLRRDLEFTGLTVVDLPNLGYHGSYVAAVRWRRGGGDVALVSLHASPNPAEPENYRWPPDAGFPEARLGGTDPRWPSQQLWDSDLVLRTVADLHGKLGLPVLAAGDLNESLDDDPEGGTWAQEYFESAKRQGLVPWLHERWASERATRGVLQLDHVLVSRDALPLLSRTGEPEVDQGWADAEAALTQSDHAPVWFALELDAQITDDGSAIEKHGNATTKEEDQEP
jgi:hypothetical protein